MLIALLVPISLAIAAFLIILTRAAIARRASPNPEAIVLGVIVNFFDTLGIGSFAPTTAWFKFRKLVPDRLIPPTMIVGLGPPSMAEAVIFLILLGVHVDPVEWWDPLWLRDHVTARLNSMPQAAQAQAAPAAPAAADAGAHGEGRS